MHIVCLFETMFLDVLPELWNLLKLINDFGQEDGTLPDLSSRSEPFDEPDWIANVIDIFFELFSSSTGSMGKLCLFSWQLQRFLDDVSDQ